MHLSLQLGSAREAPSSGQVPCSRWLQKADAHGQQLGLARARGGFYPSPRLSVLKGLGVLDAQESGTPAEAEGATSPEAGWYSGSPLSSTPLSPPQEALFVKLGRRSCTFSLGEFFCTRGRDLGTLAMQNKYCGRRQHGKQEPTTLKFLLFFS